MTVPPVLCRDINATEKAGGVPRIGQVPRGQQPAGHRRAGPGKRSCAVIIALALSVLALPPAATAQPQGKIPLVGVLEPGTTELAANPRARSAKLRMATRTETPPWPVDAEPDIPRL